LRVDRRLNFVELISFRRPPKRGKKITSDVVKNSAAEYIYRAGHEVLNIQSPLDGNVSKRARQGDERDVSAPVRYNCPSLLGIISASVHFMRAFRRWVSLVFITCIRGNFVKCDKSALVERAWRTIHIYTSL